VFDLSVGKLLVLAVIAIIVFGPERLPKVAAQAGRALRELRRMAEGATADLREGLGPEFSEFDVNDLNPRNFMRKHLFDDLPGDEANAAAAGSPSAATVAAAASAATETSAGRLAPEESPPYDAEAT
jgi:sec-independent protein translocase protein TatB